MRLRSLLLALSVCAVGLCALTHPAPAGPLNPPPGPVASTHKTLADLEPRIAVNPDNTPGDADSLFTITQPGSYYLTGNITGLAGKNGIKIAASGVTLDLGGFDLVGVPGSSAGVVTVATFPVTTKNISVVNGSVRNWAAGGVALLATTSRVANVHVSGGGGGISVFNDCTVTHCSVSGCSGHGISVGLNCVVSHCLAAGCTSNGFFIGSGCTVVACTATANAAGIVVAGGCTVSACTARSNTGTGFHASGSSTFSECTATANGGHGFNAAGDCTISNSTASSNTSSGFNLASRCTISGCTATFNGVNGIVTLDGSSVSGCNSSRNTLDGIRVTTQSLVRANTCFENGFGAGDGAGIHATGLLNRIEENACFGADRGIDVDAGRNVIIRNTCGTNILNWDVVAGNILLVINPSTTTAVSGNSGGATPSTDPNANFTH